MHFQLATVVSLIAITISALPASMSQKRDTQLFNTLYNDMDLRFTQMMSLISFFDGAAADGTPVLAIAKDLTSLLRSRVPLLAIQEPISLTDAIPLVLKVRASNTVATSFYEVVGKKKAAWDGAKMNSAAAETLQRNREGFEAISRAMQAKLPGFVGGFAKSSDDALIASIMQVERTLKERKATKK